MGGEGSGRIANPVNRLAEQKAVLVKTTSEALFIPNMSGLRRQIKTQKVYLADNTYFTYNENTQQVELYINGVLNSSWG